MTDRKPAAPAPRLGIYKEIDTVPDSLRLAAYEDQYDGEDVWTEWKEAATEIYTSQRYAQHLDRTEQAWKAHMDERGRHHALPRPLDVETWAETILDRCQPLSAYQIYFTKLAAFFEWLTFHPDHLHCYNPVLMAAENHDAAATIWDVKIDRRDN